MPPWSPRPQLVSTSGGRGARRPVPDGGGGTSGGYGHGVLVGVWWLLAVVAAAVAAMAVMAPMDVIASLVFPCRRGPLAFTLLVMVVLMLGLLVEPIAPLVGAAAMRIH